MEKSRFSLLLLEPGEVYYEDFSCFRVVQREEVSGRLKLCSKSVLFEPHNHSLPIYKILLINCTSVEDQNDCLYIDCKQHAQLLKDNEIRPYVFDNHPTAFNFKLNYIKVDDCLQLILQLKRASSLPPPEQNSMIAAITYSRQCRLRFDVKWLEDMYEMIIVEVEGSRVTPLVVNPGRVIFTPSCLYFQPFNNVEVCPVLKIKLSSVTMIRRRRFLQRQVGLELFCEGGQLSHLFLAFKSESDRQKVFQVISEQTALQLASTEPEIMTLKWQNRAISNFEYLQYLNSLADRSVNDLTQYPVYPWVIADYTSPHLDLNDPKTYRDLTKPVGALNAERLKRLKERRKEMTGNKFLYGSHYSAPAFVLFFLVRKYPQYMLCLQNGRFDHPDRIFSSVANVWRNVQTNMADFKELIPEFYDTSNGGDFLMNSLGLFLGTRHDGHKVHNVALPPWATNAKHFTERMRDALESEHVSNNLHCWIDLVFGWKQRGAAAEAADNVFYPLCYEGAVDLDSISDLNERHSLEVQIMEFGQIPKQIFNVPHPTRQNSLKIRTLTPCGFEKLSDKTVIPLGCHKDLVTSLSCCDDVIVSVGRDSELKEFRVTNAQAIRSVSIDCAGISVCLLIPSGKTVILGTFDNRIIVYELECSKILDEVRAHEDAVSSLSLNNETGLLVSGSWDGSVRVWPGAVHENSWTRLKAEPTRRFDRDSRVTCSSVDRSGELCCCGTEDGELAVFCIKTMQLIFHTKLDNTPISAVCFHEKRLISGSSGGCNIYDISSALLIFSTSSHLQVASLALINQVLLVGSEEGDIECWDLERVRLIETIKNQSGPVSCFAVAPSSGYIVSGQGKQVFLRK